MADTIFQESFETDGNGTRYTTSVAEFTDGFADFFTRTDGSNVTSSYVVSNPDGSFHFAAQDIDGEGASSTQTLSFFGIDITDFTNLSFSALFAEDDASDGNEDWDTPDNVLVQYQIDGGGFQNLLAFENDGSTFNSAPLQDTDFDGTGDGSTLTSTFASFSSAIAGTGSSLDLVLTFNLNAGDEDIAVDNIQITGDSGSSSSVQPGDIVINEILQNPAAVSDSNGEWFEVTNTTTSDIDINGWTIQDNDTDSHVINNGGPLIVPAGGFLVLSNNADSATNGGFTADYEYSGFILANGADEVVLVAPSGTEIDRVEYDGGPNFPDPNGASMSLSDPAADNTIGANWSEATTSFGDGDLGTPGTANGGGGGAPDLAINELRISSPGGSDDDSNFVEIFGADGTSLDGVSLVVLSGEFEPGQVDFAFDLTGSTIDEDGLLLVANPGIANEIPQAVTEANDFLAEFDFFGSPSTFLLVDGFTGTPGADLDADNDGTLDASIGTVIDSVSLINGDGDADASYSTTVIGPSGSFTPAGVAREMDGTGAFQQLAFGDFLADTPGTSNESLPPVEPTPIAEIQGAGDASPLVGTEVLTTGIVTKVLSNGFFLQTPGTEVDNSDATSEGIFVFTDSAPTVVVGNAAEVTGGVTEFFGLTQITASEVAVENPSAINPLPAAVQISLPGLAQADLEAFEGMRFELVSSGADPLVVIENFNLDRFGEITVAEGIQTQPTQILDPNTQQPEIQALIAQNSNERLLLDDGNGSQNPTEFPYLPANVGDDGDGILDAEDTFTEVGPTVRLGSELTTSVEGVLSFGFGEYRLVVDNTIGLDPATNEGSRPASAPEVGGDLQVASFNVLNYFTTIDESGAGTGPSGTLDPRGADSASELERQTDKLVAALAELDADVVGLQEIENNGTIAISTLVDELNDFLGADVYDFVDPTGSGDFIGTDAITTGLIHKTDAVSVVTSDVLIFEESSAAPTFALADVLNPFVPSGDRVGDFQRNRPAVAATFQDANGEEFTVAVNHFKSKGDSNLVDVVEAAQEVLDGGETGFTQADIDAVIADPNYNQGDGQGFWNQVRADAGQELVEWLTDTSASGYADGIVADPDFLIIGDLNAYAQEDPVDAIETGANGESFNDLIDGFAPGGQDEAYSFVFDGQRGSLDHALGTDALTSQVTGVAEWHINADEPDLLNYDESFNDSRFYDDNLFAASDHDPLLIGLNLSSTAQNENAFFFSPDADTTVGNAEDIVLFDGAGGFSTFFDGSNVGLDNVDIDAFDIVGESTILMSFDSPVTIEGLGQVDDSDIVQFTADSLGADNTAGTFELIFDGSDVGLTTNNEDVDALTRLPDGSLLISTQGTPSIDGIQGPRDEDLLRFEATSLGADTSGSFSLFFDGSDVRLNQNGEDVDAVSMRGDELFLSTTGAFNVEGLFGRDEDVSSFTPTSTGSTTAGDFGSELFFDGSDFNIASDVSAIDLIIG
ncbi:MAG: ExeM/NucH family extracellular endonuclease [Cyanobacteria bacterium J06559_3]